MNSHSQYARYMADFRDTPGFFLPESAAVWDFFLALQRSWGIPGNFLEIGVYQGQSAYLGALHLLPVEHCILVDINKIEHVAARIEALGVSTTCVQGHRSDNPRAMKAIEAFHGTIRWVHIDADHSGFGTAGDLKLAERFLGDRGIICVDDFLNPRYPQLMAAVYKFLFDNAQIYKMLLCGMNKCYIVRSADYAFYEGQIRRDLFGHLLELGHKLTVSKSSYAHDMGCFSMTRRKGDFDYLGRDEDPNDIPF